MKYRLEEQQEAITSYLKECFLGLLPDRITTGTIFSLLIENLAYGRLQSEFQLKEVLKTSQK